MTENFSERIENALNDIQRIQLLFRQRYGEECLADKEIEEVLKIAKKEYEEIQQYRAIGTVEECRKAREKQKAKKPIKVDSGVYDYDFDYECPNCKENIDEDEHYCKCGQAIDWSDTD